MKKFYFTFGLIVLVAALSHAQNNFQILLNDFQTVSGSWKGSLTYLDYSSGKPYTMPADLDIQRIANTRQFTLSNSYPNERNANSIDTVTLSADGNYIDQQLVKSRRRLPNGDIEIVTEEKGKDGNDNRPAVFRHTYVFGKTLFKKRKDVQFAGETEWINRHEYTYTKKPGT